MIDNKEELKILKRALDMSQDEAKKQFVAFELSIEYKIDKGINLDQNEEKFLIQKNDLAIKLGITTDLYAKLRYELRENWQFVLKRD